MRAKRKMAAAAAALVLGATGVVGTGTAWAQGRGSQPAQPVSPPGLGRADVDRPDEAASPRTGRTNQFTDRPSDSPGHNRFATPPPPPTDEEPPIPPDPV